MFSHDLVKRKKMDEWMDSCGLFVDKCLKLVVNLCKWLPDFKTCNTDILCAHSTVTVNKENRGQY